MWQLLLQVSLLLEIPCDFGVDLCHIFPSRHPSDQEAYIVAENEV